METESVGNLGTKEVEHLDTIERGDDLFYTYKVLRSNRLRSSILSDAISGIGKFTTFERQMNLNAYNRRLLKNPKFKLDGNNLQIKIAL